MLIILFNFIIAIIDCGSLTNPINGQVDTSSGTTFNQIATYSCNTGYNLIGVSTRTCSSNAQWSSSAPLCVRKFSDGYSSLT